MAKSKNVSETQSLKKDEVLTVEEATDFFADKNTTEKKVLKKEKKSENLIEIENFDNEVEDKNSEIGISQEYAEEKIKQAMESQSPKKKRKSTIINLCLLLVNIVFMVYIIKGLISNVGDSNFLSVAKTQGSKMWWLAGGAGIYILYMLAQVLMYHVLIKDITGKKRFGLAYDVAVVGKYYDNLTPFAVGGQPMQIIRLAKSGISAGVSTSIPIIKMMLNSSMNMILAVLFFVFGIPQIPNTTPLNDMLLILLVILGVIGLIITVIVVVFMFLIASGNLITRSFISGVLRIGYKLKIVKNYRESFKKFLNQVAEYKASYNFMIKNKKTLFKMLGLCLMECLTYAVMPYFVVQAFAVNVDMNAALFFLVCLSEYYICTMASSFIPLPGGTGLMEISFIFLFGIVVGDNIVWALLAWRILSYYMILAHGFIHELIHIGKNFVKNKRELK